MFFSILKIVLYVVAIKRLVAHDKFTKSIEELGLDYEDEKNSMIAITEAETNNYEDFYEEFDNEVHTGNSMDMIFFGPSSSFLRLDTESILHIFMHTQKHLIPRSRALLAWDIVTDGKTAAFLQGREFLAFDSLLDIVPEEDLYYVNFGDPSVFKYFSNHKIDLSNRKGSCNDKQRYLCIYVLYYCYKYGILVAAYKRYFGSHWYLNGSHVNELGYLLCGFPSFDLQNISPTTFRELNVDVLGKLDRCTVNQTKTLYNIAIHSHAYGYPYEWSSHVVGRLNTLFTCISSEDISSIPLEAISAITPNVMKLISQQKLEYFTKQQIMRMVPKTRRIYILRVQLMKSLDTSQITSKKSNRLKYSSVVIFVNIVMFRLYFA